MLRCCSIAKTSCSQAAARAAPGLQNRQIPAPVRLWLDPPAPCTHGLFTAKPCPAACHWHTMKPCSLKPAAVRAAPPASRPPPVPEKQQQRQEAAGTSSTTAAGVEQEAQQYLMELAAELSLPPSTAEVVVKEMEAEAHGSLNCWPPLSSGPEGEAQLVLAELAAELALTPAAAEAMVDALAEEEAELHAAHIDPATLPQPLTILRATRGPAYPGLPETTFYILGTAHISADSCESVARLIRAVRPQFVVLELCKERLPMLSEDFSMRQPSLTEGLVLVRSGRATPFSVVYSWQVLWVVGLLSKVGQDMQQAPGQEFRVALREAQRLGARWVLGDRPISVTMARMWAALSGWDKARLLASLVWTGAHSKPGGQKMRREIERLKQEDVLTHQLQEFAKDYPRAAKPLLTERDQYMVYLLHKLAGLGTRVVVVVGAGHLPGIRAHWDEEVDFDELMRLPS